MANLGKTNSLVIIDIKDDHFFVDGENFGYLPIEFSELPDQNAIDNLAVDMHIDVFIYLDNSDQPVATLEKPIAQVGEIAMLNVKAVTNVGAFLDWGLPKDLLVPFAEQRPKMQPDHTYLVYLYLDKASGRIVATSRVRRHLSNVDANYKTGQEVELLILDKSDFGYNAAINGKHLGTLFNNEIFSPIFPSQKMKGFIKQQRDDNKIDLCLTKPGYARIDPLAEQIFDRLTKEGGFMALNDKSSPELINKIFRMSKKNFKQAIGRLYKEERITIESDGIRSTQ
ncbi:CvfB family protein [Flocculibacter collagenilyticus]|uniref:CvfB family protein n=1 Tax=Flocculibacter collagenilyticus TaxID=2744479 RepID=UPI0018F4D0BD|nr:S1-like domain-containing RNA-binding protein [Flocculibacter collagenilyticus]